MVIISVLGGGATGCAVIIALLQEIKKRPIQTKIQICIFEPNQLGRGLAYTDYDDRFLLNTSACVTSIIDHDRLNFIDWLKENTHLWAKNYPELINYDKGSFLPRSLVGIYINDILDREISSSNPSQVEIRHITELAQDIHYHADEHSMSIITKKNNYPSNYCILCTGYGDCISNTYSHLISTPNYFPSPYLYTHQIKKIPQDQRILILGTHLCAIDTVLLLQNHPYITMTSRRGTLPSVRNRLIPTPPKYLTEECQQQLLKQKISTKTIETAIEKELSLIYNRTIELNKIIFDLSPIEQLKKDLDSAKNHQNLWEDSIFTFLMFITKAWPHLSISERKLYLQKEELASRYISAFPYENAKIVYQLMQSGNLSVRKGIKHVEYKNNQFQALFIEEDQEYERTFDCVINATSVSCKVQDSSNEIYKNLFRYRIVQKNYFGGIKVGRKFQLKSSHFCENRFYAAGPMINGEVPFTNFLLSSAEQGATIAKDLYNKIGLDHGRNILSRKKTA